MIRVGIAQRTHLARMAFGSCEVSGVEYVKVPFVPILNRFTQNLLPRDLRRLCRASAWFKPCADCDLFHTYNTIVLNRRPWIVTVESILPRLWHPAWNRRLLSVAARDECRFVVAGSENARTHILTRNAGHPELDRVAGKMRVVYPGVRDDWKRFESHAGRESNGEFHMVFIGREFFRKGGPIVVKVFEKLRGKYPVKLTVVSEMCEFNYVKLNGMPTNGAAEWRARMKAAGVRYVESLPSEAIRGVLATADAHVLPTLDESMGYSVFAAMATGVVPVTTRLRALPEIITDGQDGLLVDVPVTPELHLDVARARAEEIEQGLTKCLVRLIEDRALVDAMGRAARQTYETRFTRERLGAALEKVYTEAVGAKHA